MQKSEKLIIALVISLILVSAVYFGHSAEAKSKSQKSIDRAIGRAVEGCWKCIDMLNLSKFNDNATITVINKTGGAIPIPPTPTPTPIPTPTPTGDTTTVCFSGDFSAGSSIPDTMKKNGCDSRINLGDCGYQADLSWCKSQNFDKGVLGNHESIEDSTAAMQTEALAYFGDHWNLKIAKGTTLLVGFNTNGKESDQTSYITGLYSSPTVMQGVKNLVLISHKNGHVFPSAHHPAEASAIYSKIEDAGLANIKIYEVTAHNHNLAEASNGLWFIAGAGGRSHYACGTSAEWPYCDNSHFGYLKFTIDNANGNIAPNFIDTSGKVIH